MRTDASVANSETALAALIRETAAATVNRHYLYNVGAGRRRR
jgi:hypothetical protein